MQEHHRTRTHDPIPTGWAPTASPVDPGALDAQQHPQVDGGPAGGRLAAVRAQVVAGQTLHPLEEALPSPPHPPVPRPLPPPALPGLTGRVDAAGGGRGGAVQALSRDGRGGSDSEDTLRVHHYIYTDDMFTQ